MLSLKQTKSTDHLDRKGTHFMANFAVAASQETIEMANHVMDMYAQTGDKKEDILIRILALAEKEAIRGAHPALEGALRAVDTTIGVLIKQIDGIVAGQDSQLQELREKLDKAIEEKRTALESAKAQTEAAQAKSEATDAAIKLAQADAATAVEKANNERDQAVRERDDARTIAAEKSASNDLLMRQMTAMESDIATYKDLQVKYDAILSDYSSITEQLKDAKNAQKTLEADFARQIETSKAQAELNLERAVMAKEREIRAEYQEQIRQADRENARLSLQIEHLQEQIKQISKK